MMLSRWDPFSEMSRLLEQSSTERGSMMRPAVDIYEEKDAIVVKAEIPGVDAKDVDVSVEDGLLTISGQRRMEHSEDREGYHRVECSYGSFSRSFSLPDNVVAEKIAASMHDGVLQLRLPKRATTQPRRIAIGHPSAERRSQA
jgi:HSP20 family protein